MWKRNLKSFNANYVVMKTFSMSVICRYAQLDVCMHDLPLYVGMTVGASTLVSIWMDES